MQTPTPCPTPDKGRCATKEAAQGAAQRMRLRIGRLLVPYSCVCGWWHLAAPPSQALPADAVERLQELEDAEFRALTTAEYALLGADLPQRIAKYLPAEAAA